jgi:fructokinase
MFDVVALGELLIDFTPAGTTATGNPRFAANPGGAPANVLAALAKLGKQCAFVGMVGADRFGLFLQQTLRQNGIAVTGLKFSQTIPTTLAFVHLDPGGDRSFCFYRNPGADLMLTPEDVDYDLINQARIFHFGSLSMTDEPSRSATLNAAKIAKKNGLVISYDPNYRPPLWPGPGPAVTGMKTGLELADIVKVSETELELLTGTDDPAKGSALLAAMGVGVVLVTLGAQGCYYRYPGGSGAMPAFAVDTIDTTGAGDAFLGGILYWLSGLTLNEIYRLKQAEFEKIVRFATAVGSLTTTKKGAIPALPDLETIKHLLEEG